MMSINVLIVDDDKNSIKLSRQAMEQLIEPDHIFCSQTTGETIKILEFQKIELAFLDIDMPDTSGFMIAEYISKNYAATNFVFLTGYVDFAARSYDYEPLDFLTKPIDLLRLRKTLERYKRKDTPPKDYSRERIAICTNSGFVLTSPSEILYIAKEQRMVKIHCNDGTSYSVRHSLDDLESIFHDYGFFRVHQSYLVPLDNITSIHPSYFGKSYEAILIDKSSIAVSRNKYQQLRDYLVARGIHFI